MGRGAGRGAAEPEGLGAPGAEEHDGRGAVAEEAVRDQVGERQVVLLQGQRAELDREQHGHVVGMPSR